MSPTYHPLNPAKSEIRLLTLLPGKAQEPIRCTLSIVSLDESPQYEALSYVWGDPTVTAPVVVDGSDMEVTVNLRDALRRLRKARRQRILWADAICINQADIEEKNVQVPLMFRVYTDAADVAAWIGESTPNIEAAISWNRAQRFSLHHLGDWAYWKSANILLKLGGRVAARKGEELWNVLEGTSELFRKPYWTRIWTAQEFIVPASEPRIFCGATHFNDGDLGEVGVVAHRILITILGFKLAGSFQDKDTISSLRRTAAAHKVQNSARSLRLEFGQAASEPSDLVNLLPSFGFRSSSDPRDTVYGAHGLFPTLASLYPPDYTKPIKQIMHETAIYIIQREKNFPAVYTHRGLYTDRFQDTNYPTWTPDLSLSTQIFSRNYAPTGRVITESLLISLPKRRPTLSPDLKTLQVQAKVLGPCMVVIRFESNLPELITQLATLVQQATDLVHSQDMWWSQTKARYRRDFQNHFIGALSAHTPVDDALTYERFAEYLSDLEVFLKEFPGEEPEIFTGEGRIRYLAGKVVFTLPTGYFGVAGDDVQDGDMVVFSNMCRDPAILRGRGNGDLPRSFSLVGQAYVAGLFEPDGRHEDVDIPDVLGLENEDILVQ